MARIAAMVTVAVILLGFFAFLTFRLTTPSLAPLYSGLNFEDSSAIVEELRTMNVAYELRGDGGTILVPRDQITELRMNLAQEGLPTRGQVGYEIFDEQSTLGATSFVQNINQVRALEGELARTISSLARIRSARVHLVLPERELFRQERKDPTSSIMLSVRGELSAGEIRAIQHLVASAIEGLNPNRVSIIDDSGQLLASGVGSDEDSLLSGELEERVLGAENRMRNRIEEMLSNIVGTGRARVQVAIELDLNRLTRTQETYDPDGQVVRSTQSREVSNNSNNADGSGGVTVADELPGAGSAAGSNQTSESSNTTEETVNFEISRTTQTETTEAGGVQRLSVAVVVDGIYTQDNSGASSYSPRSEEELAQLLSLVRSAVGFDANRGDVVEVINLQFAERPEVIAGGTTEPGLFDFTRDDLVNLANAGVTLLVALALLMFVLRPLLRRVLEPEAEPLALPSDENEPKSAQEAVLEAAAAAAAKPQWIDEAKQLGEAQMQTVKDVGELIQDNPKQAALVVRDWLNQAA